MTTQRNQVNVRLDDETNAIVNKVAKQNRVSKSEVCRQAIAGELAKIDAKKNKTLSEEERKAVMTKLGHMMEEVSKIRQVTKNVATNVNQITKAANSGTIQTHPEIEKYLKYSDNVSLNLESFAKELNQIWQSLA